MEENSGHEETLQVIKQKVMSENECSGETQKNTVESADIVNTLSKSPLPWRAEKCEYHTNVLKETCDLLIGLNYEGILHNLTQYFQCTRRMWIVSIGKGKVNGVVINLGLLVLASTFDILELNVVIFPCTVLKQFVDSTFDDMT